MNRIEKKHSDVRNILEIKFQMDEIPYDEWINPFYGMHSWCSYLSIVFADIHRTSTMKAMDRLILESI